MDSTITELEERINKLSSIKTLSKRLKKSSDIKGDICKLEKDLNELSIRLDTLDNYKLCDSVPNNSDSTESSESSGSSGSTESSGSSEEEIKIDINKLTARISDTKSKIDAETGITERVKLYLQMKADIEQCKKYYSCVKLTIKNLN
jgi:hypothetical protein